MYGFVESHVTYIIILINNEKLICMVIIIISPLTKLITLYSATSINQRIYYDHLALCV